MKCSCGSDWFVEQTLVRPAGLPRTPQHTPLPHAAMPFIRYLCADCGLEYGKEPQPEAKSAVVETGTPQPKRRGRPPKAAQS